MNRRITAMAITIGAGCLVAASVSGYEAGVSRERAMYGTYPYNGSSTVSMAAIGSTAGDHVKMTSVVVAGYQWGRRNPAVEYVLNSAGEQKVYVASYPWVHVMDADTGAYLAQLQGANYTANIIGDGRDTIYSGGDTNGHLKVFDTVSDLQVGTISLTQPKPMYTHKTSGNPVGLAYYSLLRTSRYFGSSMAISPDASRIYVQTRAYWTYEDADNVSHILAHIRIIDADAGEIITSFPLPDGVWPFLAVNNDGSRLYVTHSDNLYIYDTAAIEAVNLGNPYALYTDQGYYSAAHDDPIDPGDDDFWGAWRGADPVTAAPLATIAIAGAGQMAVHPDGTRLYVNGGALTDVIDIVAGSTTENQIVDSAVSSTYVGMDFSADGKYLYGVVQTSTWLYRLDTTDPAGDFSNVYNLNVSPLNAQIERTQNLGLYYLNLPPVAVCQDVAIGLQANGSVTLDPALVGGASSDPDGDAITLTVTPDLFTAPDLGGVTVTLTVDDGYLQDTCEATVTVLEGTTCEALTNYVINAACGAFTSQAPTSTTAALEAIDAAIADFLATRMLYDVTTAACRAAILADLGVVLP